MKKLVRVRVTVGVRARVRVGVRVVRVVRVTQALTLALTSGMRRYGAVR